MKILLKDMINTGSDSKLLLKKTDLLHAKTLDFIQKVDDAHKIIQKALMIMEKPYLSFSGGKDSTVMLHLVLKHIPDITVVYWDAGASFPDTEQLIKRVQKEWNINFIRYKTEPIMNVFRTYGIDHPDIEHKTMIATVYNPIHGLLKKHRFDGVFVGLRKEESFGRRQLIKHKGRVFWNNTYKLIECLPVANFTVKDIWAYITFFNLPYNTVYDKTTMQHRNEIRTSYWCGESAREFGRWMWLKKNYPELYNKFASEFPEVRQYS